MRCGFGLLLAPVPRRALCPISTPNAPIASNWTGPLQSDTLQATHGMLRIYIHSAAVQARCEGLRATVTIEMARNSKMLFRLGLLLAPVPRAQGAGGRVPSAKPGTTRNRLGRDRLQDGTG